MKQFALLATAMLGLASCSNEPTDTEILAKCKECSRIYTSEYVVTKVIIHEEEKRIQGTLLGIDVNVGIAGTDRMLAIPIEGVLKGCVDMEQLKPENIKREGDKIQLTMPDPQVILTSTSIRHENIVESTSMFRSDFDDEEITRIQRQGRDSLIASVPKMGILPEVKKCSERTLVSLLQSFGYKPEQISIEFKSNMDNAAGMDVAKLVVDESK